MLWTIANHHNKGIIHLQHIANHNKLRVTKAKKQDHSRNKVTSPNQRFTILWPVIFKNMRPVSGDRSTCPFSLWSFLGTWWSLVRVQKPHFLLFPMEAYVVNLAQLFSLSTHNVQTRVLKVQNFREKSPFHPSSIFCCCIVKYHICLKTQFKNILLC